MNPDSTNSKHRRVSRTARSVIGLLALIAWNGCAGNSGVAKPKHWDQTRRDATLQLARENMAAGKFDRARGVLASLANSPDPRIQMTLARCDIEEGRYEEALRRLDASDAPRDDARVHWLRGIAWEGLGQWNEAEAAYKTAFILTPSAQIFVAWMDVLVLGGREAEAAEIVSRERKRFPGEPVILLLAARLAEREGRFAAASHELKTALLAEPESTAVRRKLAGLLTRAQRYDEAAAEWLRLIENCDDADVRHAYRRQLASCLLAAGRFEEARRIYQVILAATPEDTASQLGYATACLRTDEPREALDYASRILHNDPRNETARSLAALCHERLGGRGRVEEFLSGGRLEPGCD